MVLSLFNYIRTENSWSLVIFIIHVDSYKSYDFSTQVVWIILLQPNVFKCIYLFTVCSWTSLLWVRKAQMWKCERWENHADWQLLILSWDQLMIKYGNYHFQEKSRLNTSRRVIPEYFFSSKSEGWFVLLSTKSFWCAFFISRMRHRRDEAHSLF